MRFFFDHSCCVFPNASMLHLYFTSQVEQLSFYAGEEAILLSASINDGTLSHIGSRSGEIFLNTHNQLKEQFLGFCMRSELQFNQVFERLWGKENINVCLNIVIFLVNII